MTARQLLRLGGAAGVLAFAAPALAQAPVPAPPYEYAEPAPPPVLFENDPVIQPVPVLASPDAHPPVNLVEAEHQHHAPAAHVGPSQPIVHSGHAEPPAGPAPVWVHPAPVAVPMAQGLPGGARGGFPMAYPGVPRYPPQHPGWAPLPFDREAWLDDCHERIRGVDRRERGGIIGGLLGAIGGGVAGNGIADGERLAGTLIGAGVGGLAGLAIGAAIGAAAERDRFDECEFYLDRYLTAYPGPAQAYPGYGYGYPAYTYTYVPVLVPVPRRAVVREYLTSEWVDVPAPPARTVTRSKIIRQTAPTKAVSARRTKAIRGK